MPQAQKLRRKISDGPWECYREIAYNIAVHQSTSDVNTKADAMRKIDKHIEKGFGNMGVTSTTAGNIPLSMFVFLLKDHNERKLSEVNNFINRYERCGTTGCWPIEEYYRIKGNKD